MERLDSKTGLEVSALSIRCYNPERAKYYQTKHEYEEQKNARLDCYKLGNHIMHPISDKGRIIEITGEDIKRYAVVSFINLERKKISLEWIDENCGRCM